MPHLTGSDGGYAGTILRSFLKSIGIEKYVNFHTLRACFATHVLASGAEATQVMKMAGVGLISYVGNLKSVKYRVKNIPTKPLMTLGAKNSKVISVKEELMNQTEKDIALRQEAVKKSTEAIDKLNDKTQVKANLLKLFKEWEKEDSADSEAASKKNLDQ